jgi:thiamine biosynthesis lipoprotein ApbE
MPKQYAGKKRQNFERMTKSELIAQLKKMFLFEKRLEDSIQNGCRIQDELDKAYHENERLEKQLRQASEVRETNKKLVDANNAQFKALEKLTQDHAVTKKELDATLAEVMRLEEDVRDLSPNKEKEQLHEMHRESHEALHRILLNPVLLTALIRFEQSEMTDAQGAKTAEFVQMVMDRLALITRQDSCFWYEWVKGKF